MQRYKPSLALSESMPNWLTIQEAASILTTLSTKTITESEIFRHALRGTVFLSIYFQSSFYLMRVNTVKRKLKLRSIDNSFIHRLCLLDTKSFISGRRLIISTTGAPIYPTKRVIDTPLTGYEYVIVQSLLANSLNLPLPLSGAKDINYGVTVTLNGELYQLYEEKTWADRIKTQIMKLQEITTDDISNYLLYLGQSSYEHKGFFPVYDLPKDACIVIRYSELEKLISLYSLNKSESSTPTRISTPLSRLFWLACKHNEVISPLIRQPYKLLSIFEQWASDDGITDRLSGDTLKNALERGSPSFTSLSH
ncbi:hypothetical protein LQZ39_23380 [Enterobacter cloacae complex sp. RIVM_C039474]|uniref:Uncharacterized protein n=1 Tax=Enterobacter ludwigii TaxID=299767 RepID=A0AAX3LEI9_9ENTR|nr:MULTISPECIES: hypothetical protein [Enterobacteriaceae]MCM7066669.1 hypothetical protein [Enterobacter hormaechei]HEM8820515.1 hypothetical protein [Raoultella planticola]MBX8914863.1 hypothetical protein [Enterobacter ludwigii]MCK7099653.1 hypothetical protein [Enterobacter kobei]MCM7780943.1 hypothetical protein [Enterobacter ludwigii]